ncbi:O-antigen ligase family protein [Candidatus Uhrbacteria bacterium]|nr:O-antigen ligase family protein [Candidatus Uhrbacteria bacterium]
MIEGKREEKMESSALFRVARFCFVLLLLSPLVFWPKLYFAAVHSKTYFVLALCEIILFCFVWLLYRFPECRPQFSPVSLAVFGFIVVQLLALLVGVDPVYSFWGGIERSSSGLMVLHLGIFFLVATSVFTSQEDWKNFFWVSVIVGVLVSVIFFLSVLFPDSSPYFLASKGGSTLGNSSFLGTYLLFQIGFAAYLGASETQQTKRMGAWGCAVFLILTLLCTSAQAAQMAFFGGGLLVFALWLIRQTAKQKKFLGVALCIAISSTFVFTWFFLLFGSGSTHEIFVERINPTRLILWNIAWQGIQENPILGWGMENYQVVFQKFYNPCLGSVDCGGEIWFDRSHNKLLDIWVESGLLGLVGYLLMLGLAMGMVWRLGRRNKLSALQSSILLSLFAAYVVQSLTTIDTISNELAFLLALGFIHVTWISQEPSSKKNSEWVRSNDLFGGLALIGSLAIPITFFFFVITPLRGNYFTKAVVEAPTVLKRLEVYEAATTLSRQGIDHRRSMLAAQTIFLVTRVSDEQAAKSANLLQKELLLAEQGLRKSIEDSPSYLRAYLDLGMIYQTWARTYDVSKFAAAQQILLEAVARFPTNPLPYWALASLSLDVGEPEKALLFGSEGLALSPLVRGSMLRQIILLKFADPQAVSAYAQEVIIIDPDIEHRVTALLQMDTETDEEDLLFRFYYDAAL